MFKKTLLALALGSVVVGVQAATPTSDELFELIKKQQAQIEALQQQLQKTDKKVVVAEQDLNAKIEATAVAVEHVAGASAASNTTIGGYGEMHLNRLQNQTAGGSDNNEIDFHRFVMFFGHQFSDKVRFYSEFELEHGLVKDNNNCEFEVPVEGFTAGDIEKCSGGTSAGEVELEQAYIEWDYAANHSVKTGVFLVPVGILNETHEPDSFYGVERNNVEKNIIPATWWEGGVNFNGDIAPGLSYSAAVSSGLALNVDGGKYKIRDGRTKVSEAPADTFAYTGRIKFTGVKGLELAATLQYQADMLQDGNNLGEGALDATLFEAHASYQIAGFGVRALYAQWNLDDMINQVAAGADEQSGWYLEPSYRINDSWGVFTRYSVWDNQAGNVNDTEYAEWSLGGNYWLTESTVFKAELLNQDSPTGKDEFKGVNLGVGYSF